jgi:thiamine-phosphate pyrophosphorylase
MNLPKLLLVTQGILDKDSLAIYKLETACHQRIPAIQIREKHLETNQLYNYAKRLRKATNAYGGFLTINERIDVAVAIEANGVHLSESGVSPKVAKIVAPSLVVGVSVHSLEAAVLAEKEGADYVFFGPIYKTPSKERYGPPQGLTKLAAVASELSIPVYAIGGITPERARDCLLTGAYGIAVISAILDAPNMEGVIKEFQGIL